MTERGVTESVVEQAALAWLESVGWSVQYGAEIAPGELAANAAPGQMYPPGSNPAFSPLHWTTPYASSPDLRARKLSVRNRVGHRLFVDGETAVIDPRRPARHAAARAHL